MKNHISPSFSLAFLLFILLVILTTCKKEEAAEDDDTPIGFSNQDYINRADCSGVDVANNTYTKAIKSIFDANCITAGCHGAVNSAHGLNLATYATAKSQFNIHSLLCAINWESTCSRMPNNGTKLAAKDIAKITCWAKNGFAE
jgi:hypothetical protein